MDGFPTTFWGKFRPAGEGVPLRWHPLADHCADVAASLEALLEQTLFRRRLASLAGQDDLEPRQVARLCVLAAFHDIGKFNLGFQAKIRQDAPTSEKAGHVTEAVAVLLGYGQVSAQFRQALRLEEMLGWGSEDALAELLLASICHHGRPCPTRDNPNRRLWQQSGHLDPFAGIRDLANRVRSWFPLAFESGGLPLPQTPAFVHAYAGLVMLADWIGSDEKTFRYSEPGDGDRLDFARKAARAFLSNTGLDPSSARRSWHVPPTFATVFDGRAPRSAQAEVAELPLLPSGPSLTILEAETGAGKTEAAIFRYLLLHHAGMVDGMYFALPTRTAATQIYGRVQRAIRNAFPDPSVRPPVVLAVPGYLQVDGVEGQRALLDRFEVLWNDDDAERFRYRGWAAENTKRYLAAPIAVGTIDQVLLSSLQVSHAHLRATSLLRQLLVVDEVHASDAYMSRLLDIVLKRHLGAGGHALLMSATLGAASRARFLDQPLPTLSHAAEVPFPAVFHRTNGVLVRSFPSVRSKTVRLRVEPAIGEPEAIAAMALDAARRGAKVLVLRNTVRDCIATQLALERLLAEEGNTGLLFRCLEEPAPHHARFAREHREALDHALEAAFGKSRPDGGRIVVATQTVQQSLDLDADYLLTDLCPVDVLLQRIGRLHRHERRRLEGFEEPCAVILVPSTRNLAEFIRDDGTASGAHGLGNVYPDLRIIEATWRCIESRPVWTIPNDNRALVELATHPEALSTIVSELGDLWLRHAAKMEGAQAAERGVAMLNAYSWKRPFSEQPFPTEIKDERIATRLGADDRRVVFPEPLPGPFSIAFRELTLPGYLARGAAADAVPREIEVLEDSVRFTFGERAFVYDRLGLRPFRSEDDDAD